MICYVIKHEILRYITDDMLEYNTRYVMLYNT